jgi:hypothetical protein
MRPVRRIICLLTLREVECFLQDQMFCGRVESRERLGVSVGAAEEASSDRPQSSTGIISFRPHPCLCMCLLSGVVRPR